MSRTLETTVHLSSTLLSYLMNPPSWCTPTCAHFTTRRFVHTGSLSLFLDRYVRFVSLSLCRLRWSVAQSTRAFNSCMNITLLIGMYSFISLHPSCLPDLFSDCTPENIMLDPSRMYPESFHPVDIWRRKDFRGNAKRYTRTWRPPRYFLIDFGLSRLYDPANGPPLDQPLRGGDKSAPEHQDLTTPCNPFPTDVYYIGNLVREDYIQVCAPY
jgi:serine/threonine protein kinase